jgi:hypothetical protein
MSIDLALTLIALLLSFWALTWARRAATAAERTAIAAEKNALAAERSAMAARRAADAAEYSAVATRTSARTSGAPPAVDDAARARGARIDAIVKELIETWTRDASAWPLVESNTELADDEVEEMIRKAFHLMGRSEGEAKQHSVAVLNLRHDQRR